MRDWVAGSGFGTRLRLGGVVGSSEMLIDKMNQELYNEAVRAIAVGLPVADVPRSAAERGADRRV